MANDKSRTKDAAVQVQVHTTQYAAYYADDSSLSLKPANWVKVHGPPGHTMNCSIDKGKIIAPSDPTNPTSLYGGDGIEYDDMTPYEPTLSQTDGVTWFLVRLEKPANSELASELYPVNVTVFDEDDTDNTDTKSPTFQDYTDGNPENDSGEYFIGYNYTSGAAADGITPCCFYVQVDSAGGTITYVQVALTDTNGGNNIAAKIVGAPPDHPQWRNVNLDDKGCATILVTNTAAQQVNVTMQLPEATGTDVKGPFTVSFEAFPST